MRGAGLPPLDWHSSLTCAPSLNAQLLLVPLGPVLRPLTSSSGSFGRAERRQTNRERGARGVGARARVRHGAGENDGEG